MRTPTSEGPTSAPVSKSRKGQLPTSAVPLAALATKAARAWADSELPALLWLSKADLTALADAYAQGRDAAEAAGDQRSPQASQLQELDKQIDKGLKYVKGYLAEEYEQSEGRAYFPEFGIVRENSTYRLPAARPERLKALQKLLAALETHGFEKKKFGLAYWKPIASSFSILLGRNADATGQRSSTVDRKDHDEKRVRRALSALVHHIKSNYPDSAQAKLREFGFQKESY